MADWYYHQRGQQFGPVSAQQLQALVRDGSVQATDLIWNASMPNWVQAAQVAEIYGQPQAAQPAYTPQQSYAPQQAYGAPAYQYGPVPYGSPAMAPRLPQGLAVASMVLGIISLALFCVWWAAIPCAIIAVVLGGVGIGKANRGEAGGKGMAVAGVVMGLVAIGVAIIAVLAAVSFLSSVADEMRRSRSY